MALNLLKDPLLRADQVAEYLGIAVKTLYNMRLRGEGPPAFKLGGTAAPIRYRKSDVDAWLEEHREVER